MTQAEQDLFEAAVNSHRVDEANLAGMATNEDYERAVEALVLAAKAYAESREPVLNDDPPA